MNAYNVLRYIQLKYGNLPVVLNVLVFHGRYRMDRADFLERDY